MQFGIVAEGKFDQAVIRNILRGILEISKDDIKLIRPELQQDRTDRSKQPNEREFGNFEFVKEECINRVAIDIFFASPIDEGERWIIVHIDTAEANQYCSSIPKRPLEKTESAALEFEQYFNELYTTVECEINKWTDNKYSNRLIHAIAIEETEAWLLALWDEGHEDDPGCHQDPKKKFETFMDRNPSIPAKERKRIYQKQILERADRLSEDFRKKKHIDRASKRCFSLQKFVTSLKNLILSEDDLARKTYPIYSAPCNPDP